MWSEEKRLEILNWWQEKHPGACPICGSHCGMQELLRRTVAYIIRTGYPVERWYKFPGYTEGVFIECTACTSDPARYELLTLAEVKQWLTGDNDVLRRDEPAG